MLVNEQKYGSIQLSVTGWLCILPWMCTSQPVDIKICDDGVTFLSAAAVLINNLIIYNI